MKAGRRRFGLTQKLFVAFTTVAIIPLLFALIVSITVFLGQARIVASEVLWGKITLAKMYYDGRLGGLERTLGVASRNNAILINMELTLASAVSGVLAEIGRTQNLDGVWITTPDGVLYASANDTVLPPAASQSPHFSGETLFSIEKAEKGTYFLVGRRNLVSGTGENIGSICGAINLHQLCFATAVSVKTPVFILLDSTSLVSSLDPGVSIGPVPSIVYSGKSETADGMTVLRTGSIDGSQYMLSLVPIGGPQSKTALLVIAYPLALLSGPRDRAIFLIILSGFFAVVLASFGGNYFRARVIQPVLSVAEAARVISAGIYGNTVDISADDEVGSLARDFNRMSERLYAQVKDREKAERIIEESLREKETLLREIHHRVKNNFQIINSLFDLQLMNTENTAVQESLKEPKARIHAMALVHDRLYLSETFAGIDFSDYVTELAQDLFYGYNVDPARISLVVDTDPVSLDMDRSIPCGLILNELMTNSLKYAYPDPARTGVISVTLRKTAETISLIVRDDGVGFSGVPEAGPAGALGLTLVRILCEQIKADFTLETAQGVLASIRFPI
jgi:two-component sensor histidine kinase/HAMP domain-containing protein